MGERKDRRLRREEQAALERDRIEREKAENAEAAAAEASEVPAAEAGAQPEPQAVPQRENAPRRREDRPSPQRGKRRGKRRRRRSRIALQAAVVLLAFALLFGIVLGYAVGRSAGIRQASQAGAQPDALNTLAPQDAAMPSAEQIEAENAAALSALSGEDEQTDGDSALLMGIEDFGTESGASVPAEGEGEVVAEFNGGQLYSGEVLEEYNAELARYVFEGYSEADVSQGLLDEVLENMVAERVLELHAQELGLYELTAEDEAQIAAQAQQDYEEQVRYYRSLVRTEGMSDEETEAAAREELLANEGVSLETLEADIKAGWWMEKLYDALVADVTIGSSEIVTAYNEALADQKERFLASAEDYETAQLSGEVIVYNLPGYREIKMLSLPFDSFDAIEKVDDLTLTMANLDAQADAGQIAALQAEIDACYAPLESLAEQILAEFTAGTDFDSLVKTYGDSADADSCYICADSALWTQEVIDAAMALRVPGDVSAAVRTGDGVYLLQYVGDVPEGTVSMNDVYDAISAQTLETAQYMAYENRINSWIEEADAKFYPERLQ